MTFCCLYTRRMQEGISCCLVPLCIPKARIVPETVALSKDLSLKQMNVRMRLRSAQMDPPVSAKTHAEVNILLPREVHP